MNDTILDPNTIMWRIYSSAYSQFWSVHRDMQLGSFFASFFCGSAPLLRLGRLYTHDQSHHAEHQLAFESDEIAMSHRGKMESVPHSFFTAPWLTLWNTFIYCCHVMVIGMARLNVEQARVYTDRDTSTALDAANSRFSWWVSWLTFQKPHGWPT